MILAWYGDIRNIPEGWELCDGKKDTPDLRNRFIIGSGNKFEFESTGGNSEVTLNISNLPPLGESYFNCDSYHGPFHHASTGFIEYQSSYSFSTKNGNSDSCGSVWKIYLNKDMLSSPINIINPYFSLYYIMKL